ncbi:MAG: class I SAM-dependent methyltransferase [Desulfotomaculaceae bacterium]|nr:class I SAM-dependent methyltransferase [Desulfotomaculaceae bacterium]
MNNLMLDGKNDLEYFLHLYEQGRDNTKIKRNTLETWDERAERWGRELSTDCPFRRAVDERVLHTARYLRARGILGENSNVIDIGCGPGRYAAEFARTAGHVTGIDLSKRMLDFAADYAREQGQENVSFIPCDFGEINVEQQGWAQKFDLVFSSITPAVGTWEGLEKSMQMSRGFCFHSNYIHWYDELEQQIARDVFQLASYSRPMVALGRRKHYALCNLLFLKGYQPETRYHRQKRDDSGEINLDLAGYYASLFTDDKASLEKNTRLVYRYLETKADKKGAVRQCSERSYAWILWDVRLNTGVR